MNDRLSREDWIEAGMRMLVASGHGSLKADRMAKELGVSRGSFYWHFADVQSFHRALIERWRSMATADVISEISRVETPRERLQSLLLRALGAPAALEIRLRAWAAEETDAAAAIDAIDTQRVAFLVELLTAAGIAPVAAHTRADILYWAYLGCTLTDGKPAGERLDRVIEALMGLGLDTKEPPH